MVAIRSFLLLACACSATETEMDAGASSAWASSALGLSGCLVLCDLGPSGRARTCKVREKPHHDLPPYMDKLEPSYALKCIELEQDMSAKCRQRAVQQMQTLLNLTHPNVVRYHRAFMYEGRLCYMTEFAECGTLHHLVYTVKERGQRLPDALVPYVGRDRLQPE